MSGTSNSNDSSIPLPPSYFGKAMKNVVESLTGNTTEHDNSGKGDASNITSKACVSNTSSCGTTMGSKTCGEGNATHSMGEMCCAGNTCESKSMKMEGTSDSKKDAAKKEGLHMGTSHVDTEDKTMDKSLESVKITGSDDGSRKMLGRDCDGANEEMAEEMEVGNKMGDKRTHYVPKKRMNTYKPVDTKMVDKTADQMTDSKMADQKMADNKMADQKMADNKMADQRMADQKMADNKMADQKMADNKMTDNKMVDQKMTDNKMADQKATDHKMDQHMMTSGNTKEMMAGSEKHGTMPTTGDMCKKDTKANC